MLSVDFGKGDVFSKRIAKDDAKHIYPNASGMRQSNSRKVERLLSDSARVAEFFAVIQNHQI